MTDGLANTIDRRGWGYRDAAMRGMAWIGGAQVGRRVIDQGCAIAMARLLYPSDFGIYATASVFTALLFDLANMGLSASIIKRREVDDEYLSTAFWANIACGIVLFAIVGAGAGMLGTLFRAPGLPSVLLFLSLSFPVAAASATQSAMLFRRMDYRVLAVRSIAAGSIGGLVGVGMAAAGAGVWSLVARTLCTTAVDTLLLFGAARWQLRWLFSWPKFIDLVSFGAPVALSRLLVVVVRNADNLLIAAYLGTRALGFYALGYAVFLVPFLDVTVVVNRVIFPAIARLHEEDRGHFTRALLLTTKHVTLIALPVMAGLGLVAPLFTAVVFGAKWLPASPVISILALAALVQFMTIVGPSAVQAAGRPDLHAKWSVLSLIVYLPAFAIGVRWGIAGVAMGYLVATALLAPIQYGCMAKVTGVGFRDMWGALSPSLLGCAVMTATVALAQHALRTTGLPDLTRLALLVFLGVLVYAGVVWSTHPRTMRELGDSVSRIFLTFPRSRLGHPEAGE